MSISAGNASVLIPTFQPGEQQHRRRIATWATAVNNDLIDKEDRIQSLSAYAAANAVMVVVSAGNSNGQSMSAVASVVINWTEEIDTANAFNPTTGVFTVPSNGTYRVSGSLLFNNPNYAAGGYGKVCVKKNSTVMASGFQQTTAAGNLYTNPKAESIFSASAGDTISVTGETGGVSAGAVTLYSTPTGDAITYNRIHIQKVK